MRDELDIEITDIKTKIMSLRSQLGREVAKTKAKKSGQDATDNYKSTWMYWDRLHFLIPVMQAGKNKDSLPSHSSTPDSVDMDDYFDDSMSIPVDEVTETSSPPSHGKGKSCRKANFDAKTRNELLSTCAQVLKHPLPEPPAKRQCPFSLYIAEKLGGFNKRSRMIAEKRICDIIFEIEMGAMGNDQQSQSWQKIPPHVPPQGFMNMLQNQQVYR